MLALGPPQHVPALPTPPTPPAGQYPPQAGVHEYKKIRKPSFKLPTMIF